MSSPASLPFKIHRSAQKGELQKVVKWLRKAPHQRYLAKHGCHARQQGTHPEPQPSQYDLQLCLGNRGGGGAATTGLPLTEALEHRQCQLRSRRGGSVAQHLGDSSGCICSQGGDYKGTRLQGLGE